MAVIGVELGRDQLVLTRRRDFKWTFENVDPETGDPVPFPDGDLTLELETRGEHNALQQVEVAAASGGAFRLGMWDKSVSAYEFTDPIDYYDATENPHGQDGDITDALEALSTVGPGNVVVRPVSYIPVWELNFIIQAPINEVQRIFFTGNPTGGKFRLSFGLQYTGDIPFGSAASVVKTALEGLTNIGTGNVDVVKQGDDYLVTFKGTLGGKDVEQLVGWHGWFGFGLTGGFFPNIQTSTVVKGTAALSEQLMNLLNKTVNDIFNSFENLLGVDLDFVVHTNKNFTIKATSLKSFNETDLLTFAITVTSDMIKGAVNQMLGLAGVFSNVFVEQYWNHTFTVEFTNALGEQPIPKMAADASALTGLTGNQDVTVEMVAPGKHALTLWEFEIAGNEASIQVESEDADEILEGTPWQLYFLPDGEPAGGDPVAMGSVRVQGA